MLNISNNSIQEVVFANKNLKCFNSLQPRGSGLRPKLFMLGIAGIILLSVFLPWTQNIRTYGTVTTRNPGDRPQSIQSVISGRLEKWYVAEGDFVEAGDTIIFLSEIKADYFDPDLVQRTAEQVNAKSQSVTSYSSKVVSLEQQYNALQQARDFKLAELNNKIEQAKLKIENEQADLEAARTNQSIAQRQLDRTQELYDKGLKSLTDLETKKLKFQETQAKLQVQSNKLANARNELLNLQIQLSTTQSVYAEKMAKAQSDKFTAQSSQFDAEAGTAKLRNQLRNYSERQKFYYITAPQSGYITKAIKKGIGEIIKEGTDIVTIMPSKFNIAVEAYVRPNDLPLLDIGDKVRLQFDGWPAVVFSGWPRNSLGTFSGEIVAIDRYMAQEKGYRVLVSPDPEERPWPELLRVGGGANAFVLLNEVPLWYEIWRQLNGFPPDFYGYDEKDKIKDKAPLKSVK